MMVRRLLFVVLLIGLAASFASADTVYMNTAGLAANGWTAVVKADSGGRGAVADKLNLAGSNGIQFTNGDKDKTSGCWAAISTASFADVAASSITSLKIRAYGTEGDGSSWQAPSFMFAFKKAPTNLSNRFAFWIPWSNETPRASGWAEYDAMVDGSWYIPWIGGRYDTFAAMLAAYSTLTFTTDADLATMSAGFPAGGSSFNVGFFSQYSEVNSYYDSARGTVDWFEVGINGSVTRYDLADTAPVPEPGSLVALVSLVGLFGIRRRFAR